MARTSLCTFAVHMLAFLAGHTVERLAWMVEPSECNRVLVLTRYYLPFSRGGGPIISVSNVIERLTPKKSFFVITSDRDHGQDARATDVPSGAWVPLGGAKVFRLNPRRLGPGQLVRLVRDSDAQIIYANSLLDARFSILPLIAWRLGLLKVRQAVIAPRGELYPSALGLKRIKKRLFLSVARRSGLYRRVRWHATTPQEADQIRNAFPADSHDILVVTNLSTRPAQRLPDYPPKEPGSLRLVFISRIVETKGLAFAIDCLKGVRADVQFEIYGPIEDNNYWQRCMSSMQGLPPNIRVRHHGPADHAMIRRILEESHVFILPTLGENYGHAIVEALSAGRPAIISDQTPWRELKERGAGLALPLDLDEFTRAIRFFAMMDQAQYAAAAQKALSYGHHIYQQGGNEDLYLRLFAPDAWLPNSK